MNNPPTDRLRPIYRFAVAHMHKYRQLYIQIKEENETLKLRLKNLRDSNMIMAKAMNKLIQMDEEELLVYKEKEVTKKLHRLLNAYREDAKEYERANRYLPVPYQGAGCNSRRY